MMSDFTSLRSMIRRMVAATKHAKAAGGPLVDSMTALQVADHAPLSVDELMPAPKRTAPRPRSGEPPGHSSDGCR
jgi:hypothetical protein